MNTSAPKYVKGCCVQNPRNKGVVIESAEQGFVYVEWLMEYDFNTGAVKSYLEYTHMDSVKPIPQHEITTGIEALRLKVMKW